MKMRIRGILFLIGMILALAGCSPAEAGDVPLGKVKSLEAKTQIEEMISKRYRDQISTQLDANLFSVSVKISIKEITEAAKTMEAQATPESSKIPSIGNTVQPEDLNMGIVVRAPVVDSVDDQKKQIEITSVQVNVGLDSGFKSSYRRDFEDWLKKTVDSDFGTQGSYNIFVLKKIVKPEEPPKVLTPLEKVSNLQVLIGFVVLGVVLILSLLLSKLITSKDVKEQNRMALQIQEMRHAHTASERKDLKAAQAAAQKNNPQQNKKESERNASFELMASLYRETQIKVSLLYFSNPQLTMKMFDSWYEQGWNGRLKAASMIDAVLSRSENYEHRQIVFPDKWKKDESLHQAFQQFPEIEFSERQFILEGAYWDMMSLNMLGQESIKNRFAMLAELSTDKLQTLLAQQDSKAKALALMHLPEERTRDYIQELGKDDKRKLIEDSLLIKIVDETELSVIDESIRVQIQDQKEPVGIIDIMSRLPNLLNSLGAREELEWLSGLVVRLPNQGLQLKRKYPSLAFVQDYSDEALETLFGGVDTKMAVAYLREVPAMVDRVPKLFPTRLASIIRDELNLKRIPNEKEQDKILEALKARLQMLVENNEINLERVFRIAADGNAQAGSIRRQAS